MIIIGFILECIYMGFEELKKDLLELAKIETIPIKERFEEEYNVKLDRSPIEIVEIIIISKQVGEPPFTRFEEISDIKEAKNALLGISMKAQMFGTTGTFSFKCFSTEELELTLIGEPDLDLTNITKKDTIALKKPKKGYVERFESIAHLGILLMQIIERIIKII